MDHTDWMIDLYDGPGHKVNPKPPARQAIKLYAARLPPQIWITWLKGFDATPATAHKLWKVLLANHTDGELGAIVRAQRRGDRFAVGAMLATFPPKRLLQLTVCLSPEGQPRDPQVIDLEQRIVAAALSPQQWR